MSGVSCCCGLGEEPGVVTGLRGGGGLPPATISAARLHWGLSRKTRLYRADLQPGTASAQGASHFQCGEILFTATTASPPRPGEPGPAAREA